MNYIDFSDINLKINDEIIYCDNVRLSTSLDIAAAFEEGSKVPNNFVPTNNYRGQVGFAYYLTGKDPIYDFVYNNDSPIKVNLGGLTVNSGYLTSYSFEARPYSFAKVQAQVTFFEKIKGHVNKSTETIASRKLSKITDITIDKEKRISEEALLSIEYSYSTSLSAHSEMGDTENEIVIDRVASGNKTVKSSFATYDYDLDIDLSLPSHQVQLTFEGGQKYKINGKIISDAHNLDLDNNLVRSYSVSQGAVDFEPKISGFYPTKGVEGDSFVVSGENLSSVVSVYLFDFLATISDTSSQDGMDYITVKVPEEPFVGFKRPIRVSTLGGHALSTGVFEVG